MHMMETRTLSMRFVLKALPCIIVVWIQSSCGDAEPFPSTMKFGLQCCVLCFGPLVVVRDVLKMMLLFCVGSHQGLMMDEPRRPVRASFGMDVIGMSVCWTDDSRHSRSNQFRQSMSCMHACMSMSVSDARIQFSAYEKPRKEKIPRVLLVRVVFQVVTDAKRGNGCMHHNQSALVGIANNRWASVLSGIDVISGIDLLRF
jgi:hypothetical protein